MKDFFEVTIEIPMSSDPVKYEFNDVTGKLHLDRFLNTAMHYPCNYGFIAGTLAEDNDPIDVLVISPYPLISGCIADCRAVGVLLMRDEEGNDNKILAVPNDVMYDEWEDVHQMPQRLLSQIRHFFEHYKDLDTEKWVHIMGWECADIARELIKKSLI
jgi:inorganic pyrophosphatase